MNFKLLMTMLLVSAIFAKPLAADTVIGKSMAEATNILELDLMQGSVITEPPAVARGISFTDSKNNKVQLFIKRGQAPLTLNGGETVAKYKELIVIGYRGVIDGQVQCEGDVLWHFSCT